MLLKVDPLSTIHNKLNMQGEKLETAKLSFLFLSLPSFKAAMYEIQVFFLVFQCLKKTVLDNHFVL